MIKDCLHCGERHAANAVVCRNCGHKFGGYGIYPNKRTEEAQTRALDEWMEKYPGGLMEDLLQISAQHRNENCGCLHCRAVRDLR